MLRLDIEKRLSDFVLQAKLVIPEGITALYGPSGAGKSMLVKMIAGLDAPGSGVLQINDLTLFQRLSGQPAIDLPPHKRRIGMVFQDHRLFPHLTVKGNLKYGMQKPSHSSVSGPKFDEVVDLLGLNALLHRKPKHLSGGESQRVAIGRAILAAPQLLIMDEPLASLDQTRKDDILTLIEKLRDQLSISILYITHSMEELLRLADHLIVLDEGKVAASGPLMDVLSKRHLFPLTGDIEAGTVFAGEIMDINELLDLVTLKTDAGTVYIAGGKNRQIGDRVRLRLRSRDITLSTKKIDHISTLNQFNGKITEIETHNSGVVLVTLDAGIHLTAAITKKSLEELDLKVGKSIWALVKSVTVNSTQR